MIRHTTTMITMRIIDVQWYMFSQLHNLCREIIAIFEEVL